VHQIRRSLPLGLGRAGVAIAPAQFHGMHRLPLVQLESAWPVLGHPSNRMRTVPLTRDQFAGRGLVELSVRLCAGSPGRACPACRPQARAGASPK